MANAESALVNISNLNLLLHYVEACNEFCGAHFRDISPKQHGYLIKSLEVITSRLQRCQIWPDRDLNPRLPTIRASALPLGHLSSSQYFKRVGFVVKHKIK